MMDLYFKDHPFFLVPRSMLGRLFHFILDASLRGIAWRIARVYARWRYDSREQLTFRCIIRNYCCAYSFRVTGDDGSRFPGTAHHHDYRDDHHHDYPAEYTIRSVVREDITWPFKNRSDGEFTIRIFRP